MENSLKAVMRSMKTFYPLVLWHEEHGREKHFRVLQGNIVLRKSLVPLELKSKRNTQRSYRHRIKQTDQHSGMVVQNGHKNLRKLSAIDVAFYIGGRKIDYSIHGTIIQSLVKVKSCIYWDYHMVFRSEERRVGKECRSRWSPYH